MTPGREANVSNRRGIRAARAAVLAALGAAILLVPTAGAYAAATPQVITPTGNVTVTVSNASFTLNVMGTPTDVGPFSGTLKGTVTDTGQLTFPKSGISFSGFDTTILVPAHIQPVAPGDWTGTVDPTTGVVTLNGNIDTLTTVSALPGVVNCPIGPSAIHTSTVLAGGVKYASGKATVTDPAYTVPAIPPGIAACGGQEGTINAALPLPGTGGIKLPLSFDPVLTGSGVVPSSTVPPPTTTTTRPATASTAASATTAKAAATSTLPRTGSSSGPLLLIGASLVLAGSVLALRRRFRRSAA
jgi:LPXTG-motif cell wall-anchored protein